jgi:hypothetical protein
MCAKSDAAGGTAEHYRSQKRKGDQRCGAPIRSVGLIRTPAAARARVIEGRHRVLDGRAAASTWPRYRVRCAVIPSRSTVGLLPQYAARRLNEYTCFMRGAAGCGPGTRPACARSRPDYSAQRRIQLGQVHDGQGAARRTRRAVPACVVRSVRGGRDAAGATRHQWPVRLVAPATAAVLRRLPPLPASFGPYDFEVDTTGGVSTALVESILTAWRLRSPVGALRPPLAAMQ